MKLNKKIAICLLIGCFSLPTVINSVSAYENNGDTPIGYSNDTIAGHNYSCDSFPLTIRSGSRKETSVLAYSYIN